MLMNISCVRRFPFFVAVTVVMISTVSNLHLHNKAFTTVTSMMMMTEEDDIVSSIMWNNTNNNNNNNNNTLTTTLTHPRANNDSTMTMMMIRPQVFRPWKNATNASLPCILDDDDNDKDDSFTNIQQRQPSQTGLLFVKIDKAGSSTVAGVAARIAYALLPLSSLRSNNASLTTRPCQARVSHVWSKRHIQEYGSLFHRRKDQSFLWTILRDPAKRAWSDYSFFHLGRNGNKVNDDDDDDETIRLLKAKSNYHLFYVTRKDPVTLSHLSRDQLQRLVRRVLTEFNFIGLLERLDESLVLLQLILDLKKPSDVLYLNAKETGGYDVGGQSCRKIIKERPSAQVQSYLSSEEWVHTNRGDYLLYHAVNQSLELTIDYIGRTRFQHALEEFKKAKALADHQHCHYQSPCRGENDLLPTELAPKCYFQDAGCGYECLDRLFDNATTYST